jgi:hypothetical protein
MQSRFWGTASSALVFVNWVFFLTVTMLIGSQAGGFDWLALLSWSSFLTDLSFMFELGSVPSGSVWIAWLLLSVCWSVVWLGKMPAAKPEPDVAPIITPAKPQDVVNARQTAIESRPDVQEKLKRLNRSLSQA